MVVMTVVLLSLLAVYLYQFYSKLKNYPPGPLPLPLIGNIHQIDLAQPHATFAKWAEHYGPVFTVHFPTANVIITSAEAIREALVKKGDSFKGRPHTYLNRFWSGDDGIVLADNWRWAERRRFALKTLRDMGMGRAKAEAVILKQAGCIVQQIDVAAKDGRTFNPNSMIEEAVGNVAANVLFGFTVEHGTMRRLLDILDNNFELWLNWKCRLWDSMPWLIHVPLFGNFNHTQLNRNRTEFYATLGKLIEWCRADCGKESKSEAERMESFVECYAKEMKAEIDSGKPSDERIFTEHDLLHTVGDLVSAGAETVVSVLKWALLYLCQHQDVQSRCRRELRTAVYEQSRPLAMAIRTHVPYFAATVTELLRVSNIVPVNLQHRAVRDVTVMGQRIARDTTVIPQIANVLADESAFPDAEVFNPERFMQNGNGDNGTNKADNVMAFSLGKRACAGEALARAELFLILAQLLLRYTFELGQPPKPKDMLGKIWLTRRPHYYTLVAKQCD